jgi:acyl-CoA ligase (AMP-forming) (exosortase A-associated)
MTGAIHDLASLLAATAGRVPDKTGLMYKSSTASYGEIWRDVQAVAAAFHNLGLVAGDRVAVWLPKQIEMVVSLFACSQAGLIFIPINPALKPAQVEHILTDSGARLLITSTQRLSALEVKSPWERVGKPIIVLTDGEQQAWNELLKTPSRASAKKSPDALAAILYTSGSTGKPKGVMLSESNLVLGSASVAQYLELTENDRLLCVLPFSFDYGLNQLITSIQVGATAVLLDHLFAKDVVKAVEAHQITGLAAVPPLWMQLADFDLSGTCKSLRYITNSGGRMPLHLVQKIRAELPDTKIYLMYGLTEAFRSTYLSPDLVDRFPESVGKAIPHAEVKVVRKDGSETDPDEVGELVHAGPLVAKGYWRDEARAKERFRPAPGCFSGENRGRMAVYSGDQFRRDEVGLLYFIGREDEMIKTSGYRVSPTEIEEALYATDDVTEAVAIGLPDVQLGAVIACAVVASSGKQLETDVLIRKLRNSLPSFMVPTHIDEWTSLPRTANGKLDRVSITVSLRQKFAGADL